MTVYLLPLHTLDASEDAAARAVQRFTDGHQTGNADDIASGLLVHTGLGRDPKLLYSGDMDAAAPSPASAPFFCVSRSGKYVAAVVSDYGYVGVDIEQIRPCGDSTNRLHDEETAWLGGRAHRDQSFYCLWTAKESLRKAADTGLEPTAYSILPVSRGWHVVSQGSWYLHWKRVDGHILCVCSMRPETLVVRILSEDGSAA